MSDNAPDSTPLAVVLAAGKGTRMKSELPKVLVSLGGRPMIRYVIESLRAAGIGRIVVVVGYRAELVREELAGETDIEFVLQKEQLGTGHAVMMCREQLAEQRGPVLIVAGDSPMLQSSSVRALLDRFAAQPRACLLGTVDKEDPTGYGRIVRSDAGDFVGIIEEKDATPEQRAIREVNVSTYLFDPQHLLGALEQLTTQNVQREYYLTDCPGILLAAGRGVSAEKVLQPCESMSINTLDELALVEAEMIRLRQLP